MLTKLLFKMSTKTGDELLEELELFIDSWMARASLINLKLLAQFLSLGASAEKKSRLEVMKDVRKGLDGLEMAGKEEELMLIADFLGTLSTTTGVGKLKTKGRRTLQISMQWGC